MAHSAPTPDDRFSPRQGIPDFLEERVIEILGEPEDKRAAALDELLASVPEHAPAIREWLETALDTSVDKDRQLAQTLGLYSDRKEEEPVRIGPYRILEPIGQGGMGSVYLAEQIELLRRRVALKLIKLGMDTQEVIARFEAERQALALMNHPNIARVYDAGVSEQGRPYFVMEYVPGVSITQYCDAHRLSLAERLDLFLRVCDAVHHAHQRGVVHRDIKPSNVLVMRLDGKPVPKIIDFGVAKATNQRLTERTVFTQQGRIIGTPEYMSPEQAETSGLEVDARTDVYSLGVVLYELLAGQLPFDRETLRKAGLAEIHRIIREVDPPRPSVRVQQRGLDGEQAAYQRRLTAGVHARQLRGALDWITMRAMDKDPGRRYSTPEALAADIVRYLNDDQVEAGPPSSLYRIRVFSRRHAAFVRAAVVVAVLVIVGAIWLRLKDLELEAALGRAQAAEERERQGEVARAVVLAELEQVKRDLAAARARLSELPADEPPFVGRDPELERAHRVAVERLETARAEVAECMARIEALNARLQRLSAARRLGERLEALAVSSSVLVALDETALENWLDEAGTTLDEAQRLRAGSDGAADAVDDAALGSALRRFEEGLTIERVRAMREAARRWSEASLVDAAAAWNDAAQAVGASQVAGYDGLQLKPLVGFVPIGFDPASKLLELAFLPSGEAPGRDEEGRLAVSEASAAVFVVVPGGTLDLGGSRVRGWEAEAHPHGGDLEHPLRRVTVVAFLLGKHELTQAQWHRLNGANPSAYSAPRSVRGRPIDGMHPVESVSWLEADAGLARWGLSLPTEAQWEHAVRAEGYEAWWTGSDPASLKEAANLLDRAALEFGLDMGSGPSTFTDGFAVHAPIGSFKANAWGLHDVHGNVAEWCADWLASYEVDVEPLTGLAAVRSGVHRVHRGGSFADRPSQARSRYRNGAPPQNRLAEVGIRAACNRVSAR
jgi:serine/threonine protein kinase/formylglycine-generating enzyme required for sulfatase activity